ncbi:MAG: pilus assembly protein PilM [Candidatus Omnitrophota bacterium]|nr:pilus assembly protein PilM [Candidatus Omnitrophota bacterium]
MKSRVVLELGNHWLKILVVGSQFNKAELKKFIYESVEGLSDEQISKIIADFLKKSKIIPAPLIICLPRQQVTIRNLQLPSVDPQEIKNIIDLNIARQVPYPKEDIIYSYENLGVEETGYSKILLGIVHRNTLKHIFDILDRINLTPEKIELSSEGIINWLLMIKGSPAKGSEVAIILDIDNDLTDLIVFSKDKLLFTRSLPWGREQIKDSSKRLQFLGDIKQSLVVFQKEEPLKKPQRIFLCGAIGELEGVDSLLQQELNLSLERIDPCRDVACDKSLRLPNELAISGIVGLGLDTSRKILSFQLAEWQIRKEIKKKTRELVALGSLVIYCLVAILGIFMVKLSSRQIYLDNLNSHLQDKESDYKHLAAVAKKIDIIRERTDGQYSVLNSLYYLHQNLPVEVKLTEIIYSFKEKLILRGSTPEVAQIFKFVSTLDSSKRYAAVETKYTRKKMIRGIETNEFEIDCRLAAK